MTFTHLIVLLLVGAVAGLIGERLVGRGMPGGVLGAIVAGLVGAWLMVDVHSRCRLWGHSGAYSREEETWGTSVGVAVNSSVAPARRPGASSWASASRTSWPPAGHRRLRPPGAES